MPVQVRDQALKIKDDLPRSAVNKEYFNQNVEKQVNLAFFTSLTFLNISNTFTEIKAS